MIRILVLTHGRMAEGLLHSARMISGDQEGLDYLSFEEGTGAHEFTEALDAWLAANDGPVLLCVDMLGGTPFNVAATAAHNDPRLKVWYGINLSILLEALMKRGDDLDELVAHLTQVAPMSVGHANL